MGRNRKGAKGRKRGRQKMKQMEIKIKTEGIDRAKGNIASM